MLTKIYAENPSPKELQRVADVLARDGLVIYPTDSVYAIGCLLHSARGVERLKKIKGGDDFSVLFESIARIAEYCRVDNETFRILKRNLPGAFTFVLNASSRVPAKTLGKRKTIGVRMPDNPILKAIIEQVGEPLASVSVRDDAEPEYMTDPDLLHERYRNVADLVVDGGPGRDVPSTVVDLTGDEVLILREGGGELE